MYSQNPTFFSTLGAFLFIGLLLLWDLAESVLKHYRWLTILAAVFISGQANAQTPKRLPTPDVPGFKVQVYLAGDAKSPLVTFIGCEPRKIAGAMICQCPELTGYPTPSIMVSSPGDTPQDWRATLAASATDAEIRAAFAPKVVSQVANPFAGWPLPSVGEVADADLSRRGPWPESLPFPKGMVRYKRAAYTQSIFELSSQGGPFVDTIRKIPRTALEPKYQMSGGMVGLVWWRSDVYHDPQAKPNAAVSNIPVLNSAGFFQNSRGWVRAYPDGARFMDVISSDGKVVAVRKREKVAGVWVPSVEFEDLTAAPKGYVSLKLAECTKCHAEAGSGKYGVGLAPGGDTVMSFPFTALEIGP